MVNRERGRDRRSLLSWAKEIVYPRRVYQKRVRLNALWIKQGLEIKGEGRGESGGGLFTIEIAREQHPRRWRMRRHCA